MSEYFQGSPGLRQWLGHELDKSLAEARHTQAMAELDASAKYDQELEKLRHSNKMEELRTEHAEHRSDIGTSETWAERIQQAKLDWQAEENRKEREHDTEERAKDRLKDIETAAMSATSRVLPHLWDKIIIPVAPMNPINKDKDRDNKGGGASTAGVEVGSTETKPKATVAEALSSTDSATIQLVKRASWSLFTGTDIRVPVNSNTQVDFGFNKAPAVGGAGVVLTNLLTKLPMLI